MKQLAALAVLGLTATGVLAQPAILPPQMPPVQECADGPAAPPPGPTIWAEPQPPLPRGAWWTGAILPYNHQRVIYYPTFDLVLRDGVRHPYYGVPAPEVPQAAIPTWWRRIGQ
ncbi:MAG: hypothetical protein JNM56_30285 [Planctomycetia bacterium]|nr:hypothetical protein [Planctomycetia bacterium]